MQQSAIDLHNFSAMALHVSLAIYRVLKNVLLKISVLRRQHSPLFLSDYSVPSLCTEVSRHVKAHTIQVCVSCTQEFGVQPAERCLAA
jgi:hypothetical protein